MWYAKWYQDGNAREGRIIQWLLNEHKHLAAVIRPSERQGGEGPTVFIQNTDLDYVWDPNETKQKKPKKDKSK